MALFLPWKVVNNKEVQVGTRLNSVAPSGTSVQDLVLTNEYVAVMAMSKKLVDADNKLILNHERYTRFNETQSWPTGDGSTQANFIKESSLIKFEAFITELCALVNGSSSYEAVDAALKAQIATLTDTVSVLREQLSILQSRPQFVTFTPINKDPKKFQDEPKTINVNQIVLLEKAKTERKKPPKTAILKTVNQDEFEISIEEFNRIDPILHWSYKKPSDVPDT